MSPFFIPLKNGFNTVLWRCLHITSKRSKVPLTKTVTLKVRLNEPLDLPSFNVTVFVPFKIDFNAVTCFDVTLKRSKAPVTKTVNLTVRLNEP